MTSGKSESLPSEMQVIIPSALWAFIRLANNKCTETEKRMPSPCGREEAES